MKRSALYLLTLFFAGILLFSGCRNTEYIMLDEERPTSEVLMEAQIWYRQNIDRKDTRPRLKPHWEEAWQVPRERRPALLVVPAEEYPLQNKDISIRRFFIFTVRQSEVNRGNIIEFLGRKYDVTENLDFLLNSFGKNEVEGFNGSFITYDINYNYVTSVVFQDGKKIKNAESRIKTLDKESLSPELKNTIYPGKQ